ncbi:MAG: LysR family transcriptional regulator [Actinobacteria bacterium]|nr:LysR family transcriptional regulator [Actinomycetota bacterium]
MSSPLPDLGIRQLEYLLAVSRSATWAEAAASLGVTPSALSQGLAELERRVGVPIFDREGRRRPIRSRARANSAFISPHRWRFFFTRMSCFLRIRSLLIGSKPICPLRLLNR